MKRALKGFGEASEALQVFVRGAEGGGGVIAPLRPDGHRKPMGRGGARDFGDGDGHVVAEKET